MHKDVIVLRTWSYCNVSDVVSFPEYKDHHSYPSVTEAYVERGHRYFCVDLSYISDYVLLLERLKDCEYHSLAEFESLLQTNGKRIEKFTMDKRYAISKKKDTGLTSMMVITITFEKMYF